ncbi:MAG: hypothetical protein DIU68_012645 [Chloroflexota bacterium]|nr:MAG: hypothetical protein DIU68_15155 [Chloroflexota bacterium]
MKQLTIEYVFEGHRRGYNITSTRGNIDDATQKLVWRNAMPRGQGWGAAEFTGARSLKCFPVSEREQALAEVYVTDLEDEHGRRGIRRAVVDILPVAECAERLNEYLASYDASVQTRIERLPTFLQWWRIVTEALPLLGGDGRVVLASPYVSARDWQLVEALVLKVALSRLLPLRRWGKITPFTTLALDARDELRLVALPASQVNGDAAIDPIYLEP